MKNIPIAGLVTALVLIGFGFAACATDQTPAESGRVYLPSDNPMADVDAVLAQARNQDKLALIVMGANWCHDSRALASRLHRPELLSVIDQNYELAFVDVGYLDSGMDVIRRFGQPVIYGTPTVLIVDPQTEQVINFDSSPRWRNAHSISVDDTVEYFSEMAAGKTVTEETLSPQQLAMLAEIDEYELEQSERLYEAFAVLGPMLKLHEEGNAPDEFDTYWRAVAKMRAKITNDLAALRAEARRQSDSGETDIVLKYPEYPAFAWEKTE